MTPNLGDSPPEEAAPVSKLPLIAMAALVLLAVVVGVALGIRGPKQYLDGTPEALVQDHLDAVLAGDEDALLATLAPERVSACASEIEDNVYDFGRSGIGFELGSIEVDGASAHVEVTQRYASNDPFDSRGGGSERTLELVQTSDGDWKVADVSRPYWLNRCLDRP